MSQRVEKRINTNIDDCDDDKYFLLSLHKDLTNISEGLKLEAKAEIIGVLKKFRAMSSPSTTQFSMTNMIRNPYSQHTNQPLYNTNQLQFHPINHDINSDTPSTSGQFQRYNFQTVPPSSIGAPPPSTSGQFQRNNYETLPPTTITTPLMSPHDSTLDSMDSVRTNSSFEDVFT